MTRAACVIGLVAGTLVLGGCYERVIRAEGMGTRNVTTHESNLKNDRIPIVDDAEDAVFGKRKDLDR